MTTSVPGPLAVIAHYNLLERLEPAGPGELFRARDTKKGRTVAVRVLPKDFTEPGITYETRMPSWRTSCISDSLNALSPDFDAQ